ncbi:STAS domain-containing protein [Streptomyces sp. NPDC086838]|uniref:STAS domain-containing protein n=1 Tax=Streptomyces sp. NPDC086838 TaxID=3365762 RepID=UPI0037F48D7F
MTSHETREPAGAVPVPAPREDVDIDALPPLQAQADTALAQHGALILDASGIQFADSSFLRLVLTLHDQGDLKIANPFYAVQHLLHVVGARHLRQRLPHPRSRPASQPPLMVVASHSPQQPQVRRSQNHRPGFCRSDSVCSWPSWAWRSQAAAAGEATGGNEG